ncbi:MAG: helix-turn-helix domain-containing protein [Candidatus Pacebacteria bacterium]|nr:helix-turn-helix domain-containing protein [Candidatus Paceibacterota bacterium]
MSYTDLFSKLDLSKNESKIYESLLIEGESPIGHIATKSNINRRNVYDSMNRLIEKGLVFEILQKNENRYKAVDPRKLMEVLKEKETELQKVMPDLEELYNGKPHEEDVYVYRGIEGWKNFMRDILRIGQDAYVIGGKGAWADPKIANFLKEFLKEADKKGLKTHALYDIEIQKTNHPILSLINREHRFLPEGFSSPSTVTVFGNQVVVQSGFKIGQINENATCTVIVNEFIAETFRTWFKFMWEASKISDK